MLQAESYVKVPLGTVGTDLNRLGGKEMQILGKTSLLALAAAAVPGIFALFGSHAFAADVCPTEKRKVCIEETLGGHTFQHPAYTNECLAAKFGAKILNDGDCKH
jgi:hypothetical protein